MPKGAGGLDAGDHALDRSPAQGLRPASTSSPRSTCGRSGQDASLAALTAGATWSSSLSAVQVGRLAIDLADVLLAHHAVHRDIGHLRQRRRPRPGLPWRRQGTRRFSSGRGRCCACSAICWACQASIVRDFAEDVRARGPGRRDGHRVTPRQRRCNGSGWRQAGQAGRLVEGDAAELVRARRRCADLLVRSAWCAAPRRCNSRPTRSTPVVSLLERADVRAHGLHQRRRQGPRVNVGWRVEPRSRCVSTRRKPRMSCAFPTTSSVDVRRWVPCPATARPGPGRCSVRCRSKRPKQWHHDRLSINYLRQRSVLGGVLALRLDD